MLPQEKNAGVNEVEYNKSLKNNTHICRISLKNHSSYCFFQHYRNAAASILEQHLNFIMGSHF